MAENETPSANEGEVQGIYTISQIPIFNLSVLESAKTQFMLTLKRGSYAENTEAADALLNIVCLQEEMILKQFGECEKIKSADGKTITQYRRQLENTLLAGKRTSKLLNTQVLRRIAHRCNLIFDTYMVRLNDSLPMQRINPEEKLYARLFALVPNAKPKALIAEHGILNEKRMKGNKSKAKG